MRALFLVIWVFILGCSSNKKDDLEQRLAKLEQENKALKASEKGGKAEQKPAVSVRPDPRTTAKREAISRSDLKKVTVDVAARILPFGGVKRAKVTLRNPTAIRFDQVKISVRYYKANGELYKEEFVYLDQVKPFGSESISAPTSDRGTKVRARIADFTSPDISKE
ncbi:hypothetical protein [Tellurirhabdus bombi]|uniref:hypothetical protein n=1 Tax=Tellurirhabdus bombi TaxID=2907205 RepID=UPI001F1E8E75|nr:hypothetical protein [Tellurirhabdus bombi]